jgi:hypothetical protein
VKYAVPPPEIRDYAPRTVYVEPRTAPTIRDVLYTIILALLVAFNVIGLLAVNVR